jgi:hypothetical protein
MLNSWHSIRRWRGTRHQPDQSDQPDIPAAVRKRNTARQVATRMKSPWYIMNHHDTFSSISVFFFVVKTHHNSQVYTNLHKTMTGDEKVQKVEKCWESWRDRRTGVKSNLLNLLNRANMLNQRQLIYNQKRILILVSYGLFSIQKCSETQ